VNLIAIVVIAALITVLLAKSHKAGPAVVSGAITLCLLFAAFPTLGPAVTSGTAEFAHQLGDATDRAATLPTEEMR
jgi:cell division protein FtsW (lipid II flippase)